MTEGEAGDADRMAEQIGWVRRLAQGLVSDPNAAEDLVQETWLAFLRRRPDPSRPLEPWLAQVVRNFSRRARRANSRRAAREEEAARAEAVASPADLYARASLHRELVAAVLTLEEPYRSTLLLRYLDELPPREIAKRQGVPVRTINTRLRRGLGQLRARLDRDHEEDRETWLEGLALFAAGATWKRAASPAALGAIVGVALLAGAWLWFATRTSGNSGDELARASAVPATTTAIVTPDATNAGRVATVRVVPEPPRAAREAWTGRVLDELDAPIFDAQVELVGAARARLGRFDPPLAIPSAVLATTRTDVAGRFTLALPIDGSTELVVSASGRTTARVARRTAPTAEIVVRLEHAAELRGRTLDANGAPLGDVRVEASSSSGARRAMVSRSGDGHWSFDALDAGAWRVRAADASHGTLATRDIVLEAGETRTLDLALLPTARIAGRVVDAETSDPVAGAEVALEPTFEGAVRTDVDGRFALVATAVGVRAQVFARAEGRALVRTALEPVMRDGDELELALARGHGARGCVLDVDGAPLAGAWVAAVADVWVAGRHDFDRVEGSTGADGCFELSGLRQDLPHTLLVAHPGRAPFSRDFPSDASELPLVDLGNLHLALGGRLDGRVLDEFGAGRAEVEVLLLDLGPRGTKRARVEPKRFATGRLFARAESDVDGRFVFEDLPEGAWWIATAAHAALERSEAEFDLAPGARAELELVAARGARVRGRIVDATGAPVADAQVAAAENVLAPSLRVTRSHADGSFELCGLEAGRYEFRVTAPAGRALAPTVVAHDAPVEGVELKLLEPLLARGRVLDADGAPVAFARVDGRDDFGCALGPAWTDREGRFELALPSDRGVELDAVRTRLVGPHERASDGSKPAHARFAPEQRERAELVLRFAR
ncbi:MAG: sigma-70 family RNA polymerase sigma factor [Planctomycetes bacterium]|nr:sigma-70 family RNA polymerase sigma factor [Planctomycetota bacterium]